MLTQFESADWQMEGMEQPALHPFYSPGITSIPVVPVGNSANI